MMSTKLKLSMKTKTSIKIIIYVFSTHQGRIFSFVINMLSWFPFQNKLQAYVLAGTLTMDTNYFAIESCVSIYTWPIIIFFFLLGNGAWGKWLGCFILTVVPCLMLWRTCISSTLLLLNHVDTYRQNAVPYKLLPWYLSNYYSIDCLLHKAIPCSHTT